MTWRQETGLRWLAALAAAFALVALTGIVMEQLVERYTEYSYTIHWLETVPLLTIGLAYVLQRSWHQDDAVALIDMDAEEE